MTEKQYQKKLIEKIHNLLPGCVVMKNDPRHLQGVPDILILYFNKWAMLEVKFAADSKVQPNQAYYVEAFNSMGFASFINPENEEEVLRDLQQSFGLAWEARIS